MPVNEFLVLWLSSWAAIAFFRIAPAFALRGRTLSPRITEALGYIPPAAFAALVVDRQAGQLVSSNETKPRKSGDDHATDPLI